MCSMSDTVHAALKMRPCVALHGPKGSGPSCTLGASSSETLFIPDHISVTRRHLMMLGTKSKLKSRPNCIHPPFVLNVGFWVLLAVLYIVIRWAGGVCGRKRAVGGRGAHISGRPKLSQQWEAEALTLVGCQGSHSSGRPKRSPNILLCLSVLHGQQSLSELKKIVSESMCLGLALLARAFFIKVRTCFFFLKYDPQGEHEKVRSVRDHRFGSVGFGPQFWHCSVWYASALVRFAGF